MDTPIVFIIYNRIEKTRRTFEAIRAVKPACLYVIADGPQTIQDQLRVEQTRQITEQVDWPCTVHRLYATENMGCGRRIVSGLDAVFAACEQAIILEDDILATPAFFTFCEQMLNRYAHHTQIVAVTGWNGLMRYQPTPHQGFVSKYPSIWGWATWRRAWAQYQFDPQWPVAELAQRLTEFFPDPFRPKLQLHNYTHRIWIRFRSWDNQWGMMKYWYHGLTIVPAVSLCQNIGFDEEATNLKAFNIQELVPAQNPDYSTAPILINEIHTPAADWYDYSIVLMKLFSLYQDSRKLMFMHKYPELQPKHQNRVGWECSLQPFNEPARCLQILDHLEQYCLHPALTTFKDVFQRLL